MTHFIQTTLSDTRLHIRHQIHPEGDLRPVKRCLLDDTLGTIRHISHDHIVGLIGSVAEEVTFENRLSGACWMILLAQSVTSATITSSA